MVKQIQWSFTAKSRGYHLVTNEVLQHLPPLPDQGLLNLFLQHTSAALSINEDADPDVRVDFESIINQIVPEHLPFLTHTIEGPDDMPAHIKSSLIGVSLTIPVLNGRLALGTWQGIYLCEFRNRASARKVIATIYS